MTIRRRRTPTVVETTTTVGPAGAGDPTGDRGAPPGDDGGGAPTPA